MWPGLGFWIPRCYGATDPEHLRFSRYGYWRRHLRSDELRMADFADSPPSMPFDVYLLHVAASRGPRRSQKKKTPGSHIQHLELKGSQRRFTFGFDPTRPPGPLRMWTAANSANYGRQLLKFFKVGLPLRQSSGESVSWIQDLHPWVNEILQETPEKILARYLCHAASLTSLSYPYHWGKAKHTVEIKMGLSRPPRMAGEALEPDLVGDRA
ncbi:hypothetical protein FB451DRAFT_1184357 [Mycena latifolia]|nr:hypothetical protein FB451DRAFT_1184357 [Mycena latifolia]